MIDKPLDIGLIKLARHDYENAFVVSGALTTRLDNVGHLLQVNGSTHIDV